MPTVALNADGMRMILRYDTARRALAMWTDEKVAARDDLVAFLGDADCATYEGRDVVTVSRTRPKRFDQAAFAEDHPALFEAYRRTAEVDEIRLILPRKLPDVPRWMRVGEEKL